MQNAHHIPASIPSRQKLLPNLRIELSDTKPDGLCHRAADLRRDREKTGQRRPKLRRIARRRRGDVKSLMLQQPTDVVPEFLALSSMGPLSKFDSSNSTWAICMQHDAAWLDQSTCQATASSPRSSPRGSPSSDHLSKRLSAGWREGMSLGPAAIKDLI